MPPILRSLSLHNFRKHKDLKVAFTPGLNVIFGDNNSGKTTILRAIRYNAFHFSQAKDSVVTTGEGEAKVTLEFSPDGSITREVGPKINHYLSDSYDLNNPTPDVISGTIADDLARYGLAPIQTPAKDSLYPQFQNSGELFLVNSTPGTVKDILSGLSYTNVVELAREVAVRERNARNAERKLFAQEMAKLRTQIEKDSPRIERLTEIDQTIDSLEKNYRDSVLRYQRLKSLQVEYAELLKRKLSPDKQTRIEELIESIARTKQQLTELTERSTKLTTLRKELDTTREAAEGARRTVQAREARYQEARDTAIAGGVCPLFDTPCPIYEQGSTTEAGPEGSS